MLVIALVILAVGVLSVLVGLFWSDTTTGKDSLMGIHLGPTPIFIWGFLAAVCVLFGLRLLRYGAMHEIHHRREQRRLRGMAQKLHAYREADRDKPRDEG